MELGDVSQKPFMEIINLSRKYSHSKVKTRKTIRSNNATSGGVTRIELGNLLEKFKIDIICTISSQLDTLNIKRKLEDESLTIFCARCRKKHPAKYCTLNNVKVCAICAENHEIEIFPLLPGLQVIYKEESKPVEPIFQM